MCPTHIMATANLVLCHKGLINTTSTSWKSCRLIRAENSDLQCMSIHLELDEDNQNLEFYILNHVMGDNDNRSKYCVTWHKVHTSVLFNHYCTQDASFSSCLVRFNIVIMPIVCVLVFAECMDMFLCFRFHSCIRTVDYIPHQVSQMSYVSILEKGA